MTTPIGLLLPTREYAMTGSFEMAPLLDFARRAEDAGFHSVWTGDSLIARPRHDPFIVLAAVAAVTTRLRLGTAALTAILRHPVIGANMAAGLHQIAQGRLDLALGAGFPVPETAKEMAAVGVPFEQRVGRLDETIRIWRAAWSGQGTFDGRYWQLENLDRLPPPSTPEGPGLWLASSNTPKVIDRVARLYDGWMPFVPNAQLYAEAWQQITAKATEHGRAGKVTPSMYATITVNHDREQARAELENYLQQYYGRPLELMQTVQAYGYGTPDECAEFLRGYVAAGARHIVIRIGSLEPATHIKTLAEEICPAV